MRTAAIWLGARRSCRTGTDGELEAHRGVELQGRAPAASWPIEDNEPFALINYVGPRRVVSHVVSIADVIDGTFDPGELTDKLVLVGVTLVGQHGSTSA